MKKPFAKLFENEKLGQILVKIDCSDEDNFEAEVRVYFEPEEFGVCSTAFSFDSWDKAEEAFDKLDEELCLSIVEPVIEQFTGVFENA
jgi:hypothetical protein